MTTELYTCTKCKTDKPKEEFWIRADRKNGKGIMSTCIDCCKMRYETWRKNNIAHRRQNLKKWREANPERARTSWRNSDNNRRDKTKLWVCELKKKACTDCKTCYDPFVMDFDHRDSKDKCYNISFMVSKRMPEALILAELEKCDLVCSNCHRLRTLSRRSLKPEKSFK